MSVWTVVSVSTIKIQLSVFV